MSEPTPLQEHIEDAAEAGAARFPPDPEPPKEVRTYDPNKVRVTFTVDGKKVELKGFSDGTLIVDDPYEAVEDPEASARVWSFFSTSDSAAEMQIFEIKFFDLKKERRRVLRAARRARKRRRGWA